MFDDIEWWTTDSEQTCIANATEVTEYTKQFKLGHWCFSVHQVKKKYGIVVLEQTERSVGSHCQKNEHRYLKKLHSNGDLKPKKGTQTIVFFSVRPRQKRTLFVLFWYVIGCANTPKYLIFLVGTVAIKKLVVAKVLNFQQKTSRT